MQHPYHHHPAAPVAAIDLDPEAVIARQEAMIKAGTHAMIAEKLARDAVANQALRDAHVKPSTGAAPIIAAAPVSIDPAV